MGKEMRNRGLSRILADQLLQCRFRHGGSQEQVSQEAGISRSTLACLESGLGNPSIASIVKMAEFYKVNLDDLLWDPFNQKRIAYRQGDMIQSQATEYAAVRQIISHKKVLRIREFEILKGRRLRLKPGKRNWKELLICHHGEVEVSGFYRSESLKAGQFIEMVSEVEKKVWAMTEPCRVTLIQVKS